MSSASPKRKGLTLIGAACAACSAVLPTLTIRPATSADLPALLRFQQGVVAAERPFDPTLRPGELYYYDLSALLADPDVYLAVAEIDGQVVASGYARLEAAKPYLRHLRHAYLGFMYVEPAHRGRGVNGQVMEALRQWAAERGVSELRLEVYAANHTAQQAYEKMGFRPHMLEMRLGSDAADGA